MQGDKNYLCRIIQIVLNYEEEEEMFFLFLICLFELEKIQKKKFMKMEINLYKKVYFFFHPYIFSHM
jgi:hypothetical protein